MSRRKKTGTKEAIMTTISKITHIRELIADKGVTKAKVAERCGLHVSTLSKLLNGHPVTQVKPGKVDQIIAFLEAVNTNEIEVN